MDQDQSSSAAIRNANPFGRTARNVPTPGLNYQGDALSLDFPDLVSWPPGRKEAAARLAAFRARTGGRGAATAAELLDETRSQRLRALAGGDTAG
jgi:hypothetical protein